MNPPNYQFAYYCRDGSVETSKPGGMKTTSSHDDTELSCKTKAKFGDTFSLVCCAPKDMEPLQL